MNRIKNVIPVILVILLSACATQNSRYKHANDSTPTRTPTQAELQSATPRLETPSRGGNRNYEVRNKKYQVLKDAKGFSQTGIASWYGKKFHGHLTSNGEIYDMYSMSAAHKSLPLPTYVKVTNLTNDKSVIVRVNDRGPFHQNRIIDLSYSAAYKIGLLKTGTAKVKITAITAKNIDNIEQINQNDPPEKTVYLPVSENIQPLIRDKNINEFYIQVFATKNKILAQSTAQSLTKKYHQPTIYPQNKGLFRVQIGPVSLKNVDALMTVLKTNGYPNAFKRKK